MPHVRDYDPEQQSRFKRRLTLFYEQFSPSNFAPERIEKALKIDADECTIFSRLSHKYSVPSTQEESVAKAAGVLPPPSLPSPIWTSPSFSSYSPSPSSTRSPVVVSQLPEAERERLRSRICAFYRRWAPAHLNSIPNVMSMQLDEGNLMRKLCFTHGVDVSDEAKQAQELGCDPFFRFWSPSADGSGVFCHDSSLSPSPSPSSRSLRTSPRVEQERCVRRLEHFYERFVSEGEDSPSVHIGVDRFATLDVDERTLFERCARNFGVSPEQEEASAREAGLLAPPSLEPVVEDSSDENLRNIFNSVTGSQDCMPDKESVFAAVLRYFPDSSSPSQVFERTRRCSAHANFREFAAVVDDAISHQL